MAGRVEIHGTCEPRFEPLRDVFAMHFEKGKDVGASLAVFLDGNPAVDIWAGHCDRSKTRPWQEDTIVNVFSTTKTMSACCVHLLHDEGKIDYDTPVKEYWPGFTGNGKDGITVRHLLTHTSGMSHFGEPITVEDLFDWNKIVGILERQAPLWGPPGERTGYQMTSYGFLVGELVRQVTGKTLGTFFKERFARPLDIDFHIGVPESEHGRIADMLPPLKESLLERIGRSDVLYHLLGKPIPLKVLRNPKLSGKGELANSKEWRVAEIPGSNGHGNARSIAKFGAMLACNGELDGRQVLSKETIAEAHSPQTSNKRDLVNLVQQVYGLGWGIVGAKIDKGRAPRAAYEWNGMGGSGLLWDMENKMSFAYAMNKMNLGIDPRKGRLQKALYECL